MRRISKAKQAELDAAFVRKTAIERMSSATNVIVSANGTKVSGAYMQKGEDIYIRTTERRSANKLVMKWRKL